MGTETAIAWTDSTFNPWLGCTKVSAACDNCYAEALMDTRWGKVKWGAGQPRVRTSAANWRQPIKWDKAAKAAGVRRRVFCASLADVFDTEVPPQWRIDLFQLIWTTPHLDWLLLTKRPQVAKKFFDSPSIHMPPNVWLGTTVEDQKMAELRIPILLSIPAKVRFLSCEPLLGPLRLRDEWLTFLDWVIVGGESGRGARSMPFEWAQQIIDHCQVSDVASFMKQLSSADTAAYQNFDDFPAGLRIRKFPRSAA